MARDTLTLSLQGTVSLDAFSRAISLFQELVDALTEEMGANSEIKWEIVGLEAGSATTRIKGKSDQIQDVEKVAEAYQVVSQSLQENRPIPYSEKVALPARALTRVIDSRVVSVEFGTDGFRASVFQPMGDFVVAKEVEKVYTLGVISGTVETLAMRSGLKFTVYDHLFDNAIHCFFDETLQEKVRGIWGKQVIVTGDIYRDPYSGKPMEVRRIRSITVSDDTVSGQYRRARGLFSLKSNDEKPEHVIRRLRNDR